MSQIEEFYQASDILEFLKNSKEINFSKFKQICMKNNTSYFLKRIRMGISEDRKQYVCCSLVRLY